MLLGIPSPEVSEPALSPSESTLSSSELMLESSELALSSSELALSSSELSLDLPLELSRSLGDVVRLVGSPVLFLGVDVDLSLDVDLNLDVDLSLQPVGVERVLMADVDLILQRVLEPCLP